MRRLGARLSYVSLIFFFGLTLEVERAGAVVVVEMVVAVVGLVRALYISLWS